jgi:hypothetical protein
MRIATLCLLLFACTKKTPPAPDAGIAIVTTLADAGAGTADPLSAAEKSERDKGIDALDRGDFAEAEKTFASLLEHHPANVSVVALHDAAQKALSDSHKKSAVAFANAKPVPLHPPPWEQRTIRAVKLSGTPPPKLTKVSEKANAIVDDDFWFTDNHLDRIEYTLPTKTTPGTLPAGLPNKYGTAPLRLAADDGASTILMFDAPTAGPYPARRFVAVLDRARAVEGFFDFAPFLMPPAYDRTEAEFVRGDVEWAIARDGVLYASTGHRTYAASSKGKNAYITAIELSSGDILWQSAALVANAQNFVVHGEHIITGYGFSAEPDFLYVLEMSTGKTATTIPVKSGPSYIVEKDAKIWVRTYDTDYVFDIKD